MTVKSRVEKLEGQIIPPGWLQELEWKLIIGTIGDGELKKLWAYYQRTDPEGMKELDEYVHGLTDAQLDEILNQPMPALDRVH